RLVGVVGGLDLGRVLAEAGVGERQRQAAVAEPSGDGAGAVERELAVVGARADGVGVAGDEQLHLQAGIGFAGDVDGVDDLLIAGVELGNLGVADLGFAGLE